MARQSNVARWAADRQYRADWPPGGKQLALIAELGGAAPATRKQASQLIARLLAQKRRPRPS